MAAPVKKKSSRVVDTWKQKKWYQVISPMPFGGRQIGETVAMEEKNLLGRTAKASLMTVLGDARKQNVSATFEIVKVEGTKAITQLKKLQINPASVKRMIRKGKDRIDLSFVCATKDENVVRIKPFLVTRSKVGGATLTAMRNLVEDVIRFEVNQVSLDTLTRDIITGKLQKAVKQRMSKLYPVRTSEIRSIETTTTRKALAPVPQLEPIKKKEKPVVETEEEKVVKKAKAAEAKKVEAKPTEEAPKEAKA